MLCFNKVKEKLAANYFSFVKPWLERGHFMNPTIFSLHVCGFKRFVEY